MRLSLDVCEYYPKGPIRGLASRAVLADVGLGGPGAEGGGALHFLKVKQYIFYCFFKCVTRKYFYEAMFYLLYLLILLSMIKICQTYLPPSALKIVQLREREGEKLG